LIFIYPTYNHNWRNITNIYIASNEIFSPSNKIHREVGRAKDLSAPLYLTRVTDVAITGNLGFVLPLPAVKGKVLAVEWMGPESSGSYCLAGVSRSAHWA